MIEKLFQQGAIIVCETFREAPITLSSLPEHHQTKLDFFVVGERKFRA